MLQFLRNLFSTDSDKSSSSHPKNEKQDSASASITSLAEEAAISVYEKENERTATKEEKSAIAETLRQAVAEPYEPCDYDPREDPELAAMMREDDIKNAASAIRVVAVLYVDLLSHPLFSRMKHDVPAIRRSHEEVLQHYGKDYFKEAVDYAYDDMFAGDFRLLENTDTYKAFFTEYTANPMALGFTRLRNLIDEEDCRTWGDEVDRLFNA